MNRKTNTKHTVTIVVCLLLIIPTGIMFSPNAQAEFQGWRTRAYKVDNGVIQDPYYAKWQEDMTVSGNDKAQLYEWDGANWVPIQDVGAAISMVVKPLSYYRDYGGVGGRFAINVRGIIDTEEVIQEADPYAPNGLGGYKHLAIKQTKIIVLNLGNDEFVKVMKLGGTDYQTAAHKTLGIYDEDGNYYNRGEINEGDLYERWENEMIEWQVEYENYHNVIKPTIELGAVVLELLLPEFSVPIGFGTWLLEGALTPKGEPDQDFIGGGIWGDIDFHVNGACTAEHYTHDSNGMPYNAPDATTSTNMWAALHFWTENELTSGDFRIRVVQEYQLFGGYLSHVHMDRRIWAVYEVDIPYDYEEWEAYVYEPQIVDTYQRSDGTISLKWTLDDDNVDYFEVYIKKPYYSYYQYVATVDNVDRTTTYIVGRGNKGSNGNHYFKIKAMGVEDNCCYSHGGSWHPTQDSTPVVVRWADEGVYGYVKKKGTSDPISSAKVYTRDDSGRTLTKYTNSNGYYKIWAYYGTRTVNAARSGYKSQSKTVTIYANSFKRADFYLESTGGGGGGGHCPYVFTWNGTEYTPDNNILLLSENFTREDMDVQDQYLLQKSLVPKDGYYSFQIQELGYDHSYLDEVKLVTVDHDPDVKVAIDPDGNLFTYDNPEPSLFAVDQYDRDILSLIDEMNDNLWAEMWRGDYILLNFGHLNEKKGARLVVRGDFVKQSLWVQIPDDSGNWRTISELHPRNEWSMEIVDIAQYIPDGNDVVMRLLATGRHIIDYVGIDTSRQAELVAQPAMLIRANHSHYGDVTSEITVDDGIYAQILSGQNQNIILDFEIPSLDDDDERDFLFLVDGHYTLTYQPFKGTNKEQDSMTVTLEMVIPSAPVGKYWDVEIIKLYWDLGDGESTRGLEVTQEVSHTYAAPGEYRIFIIVEYADGHEEIYERVILTVG